MKEIIKKWHEALIAYAMKILSRKFILVLGSQRSGTTLLYMQLSSHPAILGKNEDEVELNFPGKKELLRNFFKGKYTCYKLPTKTGDLDLIQKKFPSIAIFWTVRHPYSVISSMRTLIMKSGKNWLKDCGEGELKRLAKILPEINAIDTARLNEITLGAYIWKYKMLALEQFERSGLKLFIIKYEDLVENTKNILESKLESLGIKWNDSILAHDKHHANKSYCGNNVGGKPVDKSRKNPKLNLNDTEINEILRICEVQMLKYYSD